ncbi:hypothetical protein FACS1894198_3830 [Clostridia bacterium]|nr:hypothetical protein FACS1894198_3830 [Clostridia bacterium]
MSIEQRLTLEASQLILSSLVRDFTVDMVVNHQTEETEEHRHDYKGTKSFVVKLGLKENENVILIRAQGGQKFLILDRVR